jgi:hypothetical protein
MPTASSLARPARTRQAVGSEHALRRGVSASRWFNKRRRRSAAGIAEQQKMDEFENGIDDLLNKRNPNGPRRFGLMPGGDSRP